MDNLNIDSNPQPNKLSKWPVLFLRWFLGGLAGIGISASIYFALITPTFRGPFFWLLEMLPILSAPFIGHTYLFYPHTVSFPHINDLFVTFPVLFWGLIGALLASGRKSQTTTGIILLVLFIVVGYVS